MTIRDLRLKIGLSQRLAAIRSGVCLRTYQYWEYGDVEIPSGRLIPLARLFDVSIEALLMAWAEMGFAEASEVSIGSAS